MPTKAATALLATPPLCPPAPDDTRDGAGIARGAVLRVHAGTLNERRKNKKMPREMEKTKKPLERSGKQEREAISEWEL